MGYDWRYYILPHEMSSGCSVPHEMSSGYALRLEVLFTATWNVTCVCVKIGGIIYCHMKCQVCVWVKIGGTIYFHI